MRAAFARVRGLVAWVRSRPKKVTIPVTLLVLALVVFGGFKMVESYSYMQNNPDFCRACHTMEEAWDRWQVSEHRSVSCHSCHQATLIEDTMLLIKFSLARPDDVDKHAVVADTACESCHESGNPRWVQVADTVGHRVHAEEENIACVKCHGVSVHRFTPPGTICVLCHEDKPIEISGMADMHCTACHDYLAGEEHEVLLPYREDCLSCHLALTGQKVTWPEDAPMQFSCGDCHKPHQQAAPTVNCLSCHLDIPTQGLHAGSVHVASSCQTCHQPHQWEMEPRESCTTCHVDRTWHNEETACAVCHSFTGPATTSIVSGEATPTPSGEAAPTPPADATPTPPADATPTPPAIATPTPSQLGTPSIPHTLEGRSNCTMCHGTGALKPFPEDHVGRANELCLVCHQQQ